MWNVECGIEAEQSKIHHPQSEILKTIQQLFSQHQRRLVIRTAVAVILGIGCLAAALWRLHHVGRDRWELVGVGGSGLAALVLWQWVMLRRDRLVRPSRHWGHDFWPWAWGRDVAQKKLTEGATGFIYGAPQALVQLDRSLGLNARLLTAVEFAGVANPPLLYPHLVQETAQALPQVLSRTPRVADRWTLVLAVVLLALLLWPGHVVHLPQLAMRPPTLTVPPEPSTPPPTPPPPPSQKDESRQSSAQQQPQQRSGTQQDRSAGSQGSQGNQSQPSPGRSSQQKDSTQKNSTASSGGHEGQAQQNQGSGSSPKSQASTSSGAEQHGGAEPQSQARQPEQAKPGSQQNSGASSQQGSGAKGQSASPAAQRPGASGQDAQKRGESSKPESSPSKANAAGGGQQQAERMAAQLAQQQRAGRQPGTASGGQQDLLKADIQQLLKDMSGELKQMQAKLDASPQNQTGPAPGTSTSPQLYDAASQLEHAAGNRLPIQLQTDTQPTAAKRRGNSVGDPSGHVADALPQDQPEDAKLADQAAPEQGVDRQAIPPEYKPVFERLSPASKSP